MTNIRIGADTFSLEESVNGATLGDLYALKLQSRKDGSPGVSVKTISDTFVRIGQLAAVDGFDGVDLLDDEAFIQNMIGLAFLARRKAGEQITFAEAGQVSFDEFQFIPDEEDEVEAPKESEADEGNPIA